MELLTSLSRFGSNEEFLRYLRLSELSSDPVIQRLLDIIATPEEWQDEFHEPYDTPHDVASHLYNVESDLRAADAMIGELEAEVKRLSTRTVIDMMKELEYESRMNKRYAEESDRSLREEQAKRKIAEEKLLTWNILGS